MPVLPDAALLDSSEDAALESVKSEASHLLMAEDYDGIEKAAAKYAAEESRRGSGWKLDLPFFEGLSSVSGKTEEGYQEKIAALKKWIAARPDSIAAKVALGKLLTSYAWFARGGAYADKVKQESWQLFGDRLHQAQTYLMEAAPKRQGCPVWYQATAIMAVGESWSHDDFFKVVDEGTAAHPDFVQLYNAATMYLLPRWFGSDRELRDYVAKSADAVGGDDGDMLYARLATGIWTYSYNTNVFDEVGLSWPRVRHGMELICQRFPHSELMMNYFCVMAWQAQDRPMAHFLFQHLGDHKDEAAWWDLYTCNEAEEWANGNPESGFARVFQN